MNPITPLTDKSLAVCVPLDATDFAIHHLDDCSKLVFSSAIQDPLKVGGDMIRIPLAEYEIIGLADKLNEEDWKKVIPVMKVGNRWSNYNGDYPIWYHTAKESGLSLLTSKGLSKEG